MSGRHLRWYLDSTGAIREPPRRGALGRRLDARETMSSSQLQELTAVSEKRDLQVSLPTITEVSRLLAAASAGELAEFRWAGRNCDCCGTRQYFGFVLDADGDSSRRFLLLQEAGWGDPQIENLSPAAGVLVRWARRIEAAGRP